MTLIINEKIHVLSSFDPDSGRVTIHKVKWRGKVYKVTKVGYHHAAREGRHLYHYFGVLTENNSSFYIKYDTLNLHWTLVEVIDEYTTN